METIINCKRNVFETVQVMRRVEELGFELFKSCHNKETIKKMTDTYAAYEKKLSQISEKLSICEILPGTLYLGSAFGAKDKEALKQLGVTHIVNASIEIQNYHPNDFEYMQLELYDVADSSQQLYELLPSIHSFIHDQKVFVHCVQGISRSASIVLSYLIKYHNMTLRQAFEHVKLKRSEINPNDGFIQMLMNIEKECHPDLTDNTWSHKDMIVLEMLQSYSKLSEEFIRKTLDQKEWDVEKSRRVFFMKSM
jgi:protein-tyrosine phosphatase